MTAPMKIYRRSELEATDCLARYKAIWEDGLDDASDAAIRGQAFHAIKHIYIQKLVAAQLPADEELATIAFIEGIAESKCPNRLVTEVRELWERHVPHFGLDLDKYVLSEEKQVSFGGLTFTPDLVYAHPDRNELELKDDKTFYVALTEEQARAEFQARFYVRIAMSLWPGFATYRFTYHFVRFGSTVSVVFTADELVQLDREVTAAIAKIEHARLTGSWPATAGPSCTYCQLKCPLVDQAITMPKRMTTIVEAETLAEWTLAAERMVKDAKKLLKQYCTMNGGVNVNGVVWQNRPVVERKYPLDRVTEMLKFAGLGGSLVSPDGEELTISHSALKKIFKQVPAIEEGLKPYIQEKTTYRFSARKPGVGDEGDE